MQLLRSFALVFLAAAVVHADSSFAVTPPNLSRPLVDHRWAEQALVGYLAAAFTRRPGGPAFAEVIVRRESLALSESDDFDEAPPPSEVVREIIQAGFRAAASNPDAAALALADTIVGQNVPDLERRFAVMLARDFVHPAVSQALITLATSSEAPSDLRIVALHSLETHRSIQCAEMVRRLLIKPHQWMLLAAAASVLRVIEDKRAIPPLMSLQRHWHLYVRQEATQALAKIPPLAVLPFLASTKVTTSAVLPTDRRRGRVIVVALDTPKDGHGPYIQRRLEERLAGVEGVTVLPFIEHRMTDPPDSKALRSLHALFEKYPGAAFVVNVSLGDDRDPALVNGVLPVPFVREAGRREVVFVVSAGNNNGHRVGLPRSDNVVTVAGADSSLKRKAPNSDFGADVNVVAYPGQQPGTSFAIQPVVATLAKAFAASPTVPLSELITRVLASAKPLRRDPLWRRGLLGTGLLKDPLPKRVKNKRLVLRST
jgi:hypothetical protein